MWLLALKAMLGDRGKLVTSLLGVAFAVVLVNLQGGLLLGMIRKASLLVDYGQADIWIGHRHMNDVDIGTFIPERWIHRVRAVDGVDSAEPYIVMFSQIAMPDGKFENVAVVGSDPASLLGNAWVMADGDPRAILDDPDGILVDACDAERLSDCRVGDTREIAGRRVRVVGMTHGIVGFTTQPYIFTTLERARRKYTIVPPGQCSFYLVRAEPGVDVRTLCAHIQERVPELAVLDKHTYSRMCMEYWLTRTGIGVSFGLAAVLGLMVGLAVVAQTLYASVTERLKEFATLKALGANDHLVGRFLIVQALGNAVLGSAVGLVVAQVVGRLLDTPRAPVVFTGWIAFVSALLVGGVCLLASWLPYWRICRIDPASVLRN